VYVCFRIVCTKMKLLWNSAHYIFPPIANKVWAALGLRIEDMKRFF